MSEDVEQLSCILTDLIEDLTIATEAVRDRGSKIHADRTTRGELHQSYLRMCLTFLVISLGKTEEVLEHCKKRN
jgi:hypothetical protein